MISTHKKQTELEISNRRAKVAELALDGYSQREIAARLVVSLGTVNKDIKAVNESWKTDAQESLMEHKRKELARLDKVIQRAVEGWQRSCKTDVVVQKTEGERDGVKEKKTVATRREQSGDPAFLAQIQSAVAKRVKILGLESAFLMGDDDGDETGSSEPGRINRVSDVLSGILLAAPALVAGDGSNGKQVDTPRANGKANGVSKP